MPRSAEHRGKIRHASHKSHCALGRDCQLRDHRLQRQQHSKRCAKRPGADPHSRAHPRRFLQRRNRFSALLPLSAAADRYSRRTAPVNQSGQCRLQPCTPDCMLAAGARRAGCSRRCITTRRENHSIKSSTSIRKKSRCLCCFPCIETLLLQLNIIKILKTFRLKRRISLEITAIVDIFYKNLTIIHPVGQRSFQQHFRLHILEPNYIPSQVAGSLYRPFANTLSK